MNSILELPHNSPEWNGKIYHYLFSESLDKILKAGALTPININKDPEAMKFYEDLSETGKAEDQWVKIYNKLYQGVLHKPYQNYGIYMTTVDLFPIFPHFKYRFVFTTNQLPNDTVIQVGAKIKKVNSEQDIREVANQFLDPKKVKCLFLKYKFHFKRLPQIVNFSDSIAVSRKNLECRE